MNAVQKNRLLFIGGAVLLIAAYPLAFKKTLELKKQVVELQNQVEKSKGITTAIGQLQQEVGSLESSLGIKDQGWDHVQRDLLGIAGHIADSLGVRIREVDPVHLVEESGVNVATQGMTLEGGFASLVRLLNKIESEEELPRVVSAKFAMSRDNDTRKDHLNITIYAQSIHP
jgi:hypothetical protein